MRTLASGLLTIAALTAPIGLAYSNSPPVLTTHSGLVVAPVGSGATTAAQVVATGPDNSPALLVHASDSGSPSAPANPEWVNKLIVQFQNAPVGSPPQSIWRYEYKTQSVYYIPPQCCDQLSVLYDSKGNVICAPDGGLSGHGDRKCPDFYDILWPISERRTAANETLIWRDLRTRAEVLNVSALAIDPTSPSTLYAGTNGGGVFKSTNGGGSWSAADTSLPRNALVFAFAIGPIAPSALYAGGGRGMFKSTDAGGSWSAAAATTGLIVNALAIDPTSPSTLYAGTNDVGVFKSTDAGGSWNAANTGLPRNALTDVFTRASIHVSALVIDPTLPSTLYAGAAATSSSGGGVFKSTDGGGRWSAANTGLPGNAVLGALAIRVSALAIDPASPRTLYAGTSDAASPGEFKSTDGGKSWSVVNLPSGGVVFKSTDGGGSWNALNLPSRGVNALTVDPVSPSTVYAGTVDAASPGMFKSTNGGGSWNAANVGLPSRAYAARLAIDPATPTTIYAAVGSSGVFKSTNGGGSWSAANTGLR